MVERAVRLLARGLLPALAAQRHPHPGACASCEPADRDWVEEYYRTQVRPVLTPLAIDPAHPFPQLLNKSLNLIVRAGDDAQNGEALKHLAVVQVPRILPRLVSCRARTGARTTSSWAS